MEIAGRCRQLYGIGNADSQGEGDEHAEDVDHGSSGGSRRQKAAGLVVEDL
ncbi:MAG: hypothetical protein QM368_03155 [Bacillota bacterium]|jgi:hypothetical protein|nr:hypothetical protein [Bacillota bacterium]HHU29942.1 hypothetical protein [Bacillota bacterium]